MSKQYVDGQIEKIEIPDVSKFIDNTVDDLLNYYLKNETYSKEEVKTAINSRINELVNGAPETFDTLKEIADYLTQHEEVAIALNEAIGNKVDKQTGKSLISDAEINRLKDVDNYDDTELRQKITAIETELKQKNAILKSQFPMRRDRRREYYVDR